MSKFANIPLPASRLGFHYFPDTYHYREADLQVWLPVLQDTGASWLVLRSDLDRAIPEYFLQGLRQAGIEPLIHFPLSLERLPDLKETGILLDVYARWGARFVMFYERPNARAVWPASSWVQQDLVERFLDRYLPLAGIALQSGMAPVFPPLEPGGSYWDTAFLRSALQAMQRRKQDQLLENLVLSAYGWTGGEDEPRSLDWGAGGPERWPLARPYHLPTDSQDHRGFRIFDWYLAVARSVLQESCPLFLLQAGFPGDPDCGGPETGWSAHTAQNYLHIARLLAGEKVMDALDERNQLEAIPEEVIGCAFWLLGADAASPYARQAWFQEEDCKHPALDPIRAWWRARKNNLERQEAQRPESPDRFAIRHYLLLPGYEWGVSDWYLEVIRPFVKKYRPTIGFSPDEAEKAERVTVVGNEHNFPDDLMARLERAGCQVEQIRGDGTNIATELAER